MASSVDIFLQQETHVFLNPRFSQTQKENIHNAVDKISLKNHIWVASSGTENFKPNTVKMVGLSKDAFLLAANSVCTTLSIDKRDVYLNALPFFHVSGLATLARHAASGCVHVQIPADTKWAAKVFCELLQQHQITWTSLVPTQIYDIVLEQRRAPKSLKCVLVGGGVLSAELNIKAKELGWALLSTYGMTETAAMLAYSSTSITYELFPHIIQCRSDNANRLQIFSKALFSGYLFVDNTGGFEFVDPKNQGWFTSDDKVIVDGQKLQLLGRESELIKIKGESVSLFALNRAFEDFCLQKNIIKKMVIVSMPDERDGHSLCLVTCDGPVSPAVLQEFNAQRMPYERILSVKHVDHIPRTDLGKVDVAATRRML